MVGARVPSPISRTRLPSNLWLTNVPTMPKLNCQGKYHSLLHSFIINKSTVHFVQFPWQTANAGSSTVEVMPVFEDGEQLAIVCFNYCDSHKIYISM